MFARTSPSFRCKMWAPHIGVYGAETSRTTISEAPAKQSVVSSRLVDLNLSIARFRPRPRSVAQVAERIRASLLAANCHSAGWGRGHPFQRAKASMSSQLTWAASSSGRASGPFGPQGFFQLAPRTYFHHTVVARRAFRWCEDGGSRQQQLGWDSIFRRAGSAGSTASSATVTYRSPRRTRWTNGSSLCADRSRSRQPWTHASGSSSAHTSSWAHQERSARQANGASGGGQVRVAANSTA